MKHVKLFENFDKEMVIDFADMQFTIAFGKYGNDRIAMELVDKETGEGDIRPTVNIPEEPLSGKEIIIKNYSANEGILDILVAKGIVSKPKREARVVDCWVVDLLVDPKDFPEVQ